MALHSIVRPCHWKVPNVGSSFGALAWEAKPLWIRWQNVACFQKLNWMLYVYIYIILYVYDIWYRNIWYICCDLLRIAIEWYFSDFGVLDQISIYNIWKKCTHKYIELIGLVDLVSMNTWWQRTACVCRKHAQGRRLALFLMKRSSHRPGVLRFSKFAFWLYILIIVYCLSQATALAAKIWIQKDSPTAPLVIFCHAFGAKSQSFCIQVCYIVRKRIEFVPKLQASEILSSDLEPYEIVWNVLTFIPFAKLVDEPQKPFVVHPN